MAPAGNPVPSPHVSQYRGLGGGGGMLVPGGALSSLLPMAAVITLFRAGRLVVYFLVSRFSALWCRSARPRVALRGGQEEGLGAPPCTPPPLVCACGLRGSLHPRGGGAGGIVTPRAARGSPVPSGLPSAYGVSVGLRSGRGRERGAGLPAALTERTRCSSPSEARCGGGVPSN